MQGRSQKLVYFSLNLSFLPLSLEWVVGQLLCPWSQLLLDSPHQEPRWGWGKDSFCALVPLHPTQVSSEPGLATASFMLLIAKRWVATSPWLISPKFLHVYRQYSAGNS